MRFVKIPKTPKQIYKIENKNSGSVPDFITVFYEPKFLDGYTR